MLTHSSLLRCLLLLSCLSTQSLACGDGSETVATDAAIEDDAEPVCANPIDCATWLQDYEREVVSKIAGHSPIAEGLTVSARFRASERDAVRSYIASELETHGQLALLHDYGTGSNVFARLPATEDGAPLILMGCHFDGIEGSPAAGDDGTGVALVLAAARYFASQDKRPNEMIFAFFDEEESGLIGSQAFAEKLRMEDPDLVAAHLYDLISWDEDEDGAVELWSPATDLEALYRSVGGELGIEVRAVEFDASDHASFIGSGFSAVGVSEEFVSGDFNPNYHTPEDTYENIDFDYLERITRMALVVNSRAQ